MPRILSFIRYCGEEKDSWQLWGLHAKFIKYFREGKKNGKSEPGQFF